MFLPASDRGPLSVLCRAVFRLQRNDGAWCCQLRRECVQQKDAASVLTRWLRAELPDARLGLASGQYISSYSLRIAGVSFALAAGYDLEWCRKWGLWKTPSQVHTYNKVVAFSEFYKQLFIGGRLSTQQVVRAGQGDVPPVVLSARLELRRMLASSSR